MIIIAIPVAIVLAFVAATVCRTRRICRLFVWVSQILIFASLVVLNGWQHFLRFGCSSSSSSSTVVVVGRVLIRRIPCSRVHTPASAGHRRNLIVAQRWRVVTIAIIVVVIHLGVERIRVWSICIRRDDGHRLRRAWLLASLAYDYWHFWQHLFYLPTGEGDLGSHHEIAIAELVDIFVVHVEGGVGHEILLVLRQVAEVVNRVTEYVVVQPLQAVLVDWTGDTLAGLRKRIRINATHLCNESIGILPSPTDRC